MVPNKCINLKPSACDLVTIGSEMKSYETTTEAALSTNERREQLARFLEGYPRVAVQELSAHFCVSAVTIRKDLAWLEERKRIVRTHGGAMFARSARSEQGFEIREQLQREEKLRIGRLAASLVEHGDSIALDASTTVLAMAQFLMGKSELTVVTNGLRMGMELGNAPGISILMPGGMLRRESLSFVGAWGSPVLRQINIKTAFVGARGLTIREGLTEVSNEEVAFKRALVDAAHEIVALVDHTKWDQVAFATFCPLDRIKLVITDAQAPAEMLEQLRSRGIDVWIA